MSQTTDAGEEPRMELVAYLDGELDVAAARAVEQRLQGDAQLRAQAEALKKTWELLDFLPQPEPSPTFTSRTLDKLAVLRPSSTATAVTMSKAVSTRTPSVVVPVSRPRVWPRRLAWATAGILLFAGGYWSAAPLVTRSGARPLAPKDMEEQMARDLRVLDNLPLYQYGDDLNFLFGLDQPELFGDNASGR